MCDRKLPSQLNIIFHNTVVKAYHDAHFGKNNLVKKFKKVNFLKLNVTKLNKMGTIKMRIVKNSKT